MMAAFILAGIAHTMTWQKTQCISVPNDPLDISPGVHLPLPRMPACTLILYHNVFSDVLVSLMLSQTLQAP